MLVKLLAKTPYGEKGSVVEVPEKVAKAYGEKYMEVQKVEKKVEKKEVKEVETKEVKGGKTK